MTENNIASSSSQVQDGENVDPHLLLNLNLVRS